MSDKTLNVYNLYRGISGLTVNELAQKMGISAAYLSEVERGKKKASMEFVSKFCEAMDVKKSVIMYFEETIDEKKLNRQQALLTILQKICEKSPKPNEADGAAF